VVRILFLGTGLYFLGLNFSKVVLSPGSSGLIFRDWGVGLFWMGFQIFDLKLAVGKIKVVVQIM
jgi:hypothetical protein